MVGGTGGDSRGPADIWEWPTLEGAGEKPLSLLGVIFEGANDPSFSDSVPLSMIKEEDNILLLPIIFLLVNDIRLNISNSL